MIPCDTVNYLDKEYGSSRWQIPKSSILKFELKNIKNSLLKNFIF